MIQIGCIADDFTGASDWASFFAEKGISTILFNGIPEADIKTEDADVAVIALKTRTEPKEEAVKESVEALAWLRKQGTKQYYIKYCSTFDCKKDGNIGPVIDAAMDYLGETATVVCPALPVNGRTVRNGCLYVNGVELQNSSMKDHPLTPMWDCRIKELMRQQSSGEVVVMPKKICEKSDVQEWMGEYQRKKKHIYFVPDFYEQEQGKRIVEIFEKFKLLTGGSGVSTFLAENLEHQDMELIKGQKTPAIIIAGSCSVATLGQITEFLETGKKAYKMSPRKILEGTESADTIWKVIGKWKEDDILLYSSEDASTVEENQKNENISMLIEQIQAQIAQQFVREGRKRVIVAGGETSGAVTKKLGYDRYYVGGSIAPGVPVLIPVQEPEIRLVLKSGNFGKKDFFIRALEYTRG